MHNVYQGEIFHDNCIKEATEMALQYTSPSGPDSLVTFFNLFKQHLAKEIQIDPSAEKDALDIFGVCQVSLWKGGENYHENPLPNQSCLVE